MIIRRKHTANYTTIGNELFNDERLAADEVGILAFLLSRPNDWEVRRPALMRRWNVGRDAMKRIMTSWMKSGWCRAEKTRLANGTFHIVYEIRDQPGPTLSDEEVRRALSLVSSEAADGRSDDSHGPAEGSGHPPSTDPPPTGQPGVADQRAVGRMWPIEDSLKPESPKTTATDIATRGEDQPKMISPEAIDLAVKIARIAGHDPEFLPVRWISDGPAIRAQMMLNRGFQPEMMIDVAKSMMHRKPDGKPPWSITYFEDAFSEAHCRQSNPAPLPTVSPSSLESPNAKTRLRAHHPRGPSHSTLARDFARRANEAEPGGSTG